jgi:hypothetical protein
MTGSDFLHGPKAFDLVPASDTTRFFFCLVVLA